MCDLKALLAERHDQWEEEEKYAKCVIKSTPSYARAYSLLGYSLIQQKRYQEAIENYTRAIELAPQNVSYWGNRCYCYNWTTDFEKAIHDCTQAIELNEKYAFGYQQRKYAYERLGKNREAEADREVYEQLTQNEE